MPGGCGANGRDAGGYAVAAGGLGGGGPAGPRGPEACGSKRGALVGRKDLLGFVKKEKSVGGADKTIPDPDSLKGFSNLIAGAAAAAGGSVACSEGSTCAVLLCAVG